MDEYQAGNWKITSERHPMLNSAELDELSARINGAKTPDMVFGRNHFTFTNSAFNFVYTLRAEPALHLTDKVFRQSKLEMNQIKHDSINEVPKDVKVADAAKWEERKVPKDALFMEPGVEQEDLSAKIVEASSDWTYSSPYKGTIETAEGEGLPASLSIERTNDQIPVERLGQDNPILWNNEIVLYEDELEDCGGSKFYVRVRAMADCWFALVRFYCRVDGVLVRIYDTRIFHDYTTNELLREFQVKESTYAELNTAGFPFSSDWAVSPNQADTVFSYLKLKKVFRDKISY